MDLDESSHGSNYEEALELMKQGYPVKKGYAIYFIPFDKEKTEENIKYYSLDENEPHESDIDDVDKKNGGFFRL